MKKIALKYNKNTIYNDVLKVIEYPCRINIIKMLDIDVYEYNYEFYAGSWAHDCIRDVKVALYLDDNCKNLEDGLVIISVFNVDEYVDYVIKEGGKINSDTSRKLLVASDYDIINYYKRISEK